jgi:hypothetical protein
MKHSALICRTVFEQPGLTSRELVEICQPDKEGSFRVSLTLLHQRGEIVRIDRRYYPSEALIRRHGLYVKRMHKQAVRKMKSGRIRVLGHTIDKDKIDRLIEKLQEVR